jgi:hypothetical protein
MKTITIKKQQKKKRVSAEKSQTTIAWRKNEKNEGNVFEH